jgi:hypothetical protein
MASHPQASSYTAAYHRAICNLIWIVVAMILPEQLTSRTPLHRGLSLSCYFPFAALPVPDNSTLCGELVRLS